jgi:cell division protein ZapA (FtsZ GTPase activity inhibitor)
VSDRNSVSVRLRGREFRIRGEEDPEQLQRVAGFLDETMARVEAKTGAVDSLGVAMLTALNLAREVVETRDRTGPSAGADPKRLRSLIELAEAALDTPPPRG